MTQKLVTEIVAPKHLLFFIVTFARKIHTEDKTKS